MNKQKLSSTDLLTKVVFIPESPIFIINLFRQILKRLFVIIGRLVAVILL